MRFQPSRLFDWIMSLMRKSIKLVEFLLKALSIFYLEESSEENQLHACRLKSYKYHELNDVRIRSVERWCNILLSHFLCFRFVCLLRTLFKKIYLQHDNRCRRWLMLFPFFWSKMLFKSIAVIMFVTLPLRLEKSKNSRTLISRFIIESQRSRSKEKFLKSPKNKTGKTFLFW